MSVRKYTTNITVPSHETVDGINIATDYLTGIGEVSCSSLQSCPVVLKFTWETDQNGAFAHGYALCEAEHEVNTMLASYGWNPIHRNWVRA